MRLVLFTSVLLTALYGQSATRIAIDPGHGGSDRGAVHEKTKESHIALGISKKLHKLIQKDKRFSTLLLRKTDKDLSLDQRVKMAAKFKADLFVSIHANAHSNKKSFGAEFYIQNQLPMNEENLFLAHQEHQMDDSKKQKHKSDVESILFDLKKNHRILKSYHLGWYLRKKWTGAKKSRMIRQGPFYVLSQTESPAVLVEVGYLSNQKERASLRKASEQQKIARRIYNGLVQFTKNMDKALPSQLKR